MLDNVENTEEVKEEITEEVKDEQVSEEVKKEVEEEVKEAIPAEKSEKEEPKEDEKFKKHKKTYAERIKEKTASEYRWQDEIKASRDREKGINLDRPITPIYSEFIDENGSVDHKAFRTAMDKFYDDLDDWKNSKRSQENREVEVKAELETKKEIYSEQAEEILEKYPNFNEVCGKDIYSNNLVDAIHEIAITNPDSTIAPELAFYLGNNVKELARFNAMSPKMMLLELGELKHRVQSLNKQSSKAPKPLATLDAEKESIIKDELYFPEGEDDAWYKKRKELKMKEIQKKYKT